MKLQHNSIIENRGGWYMKRLNTLLIILIAGACTLANAARAESGPFGLRAGMTLEELRKLVPLKKEKGYQYSSPRAPNPHSAFDDYRYLITPVHGLCKVVAWTPSIESDSHGGAVRSKFNSLAEGLQAKYGAPNAYDFLKAGSIWNDPQDWMMGLSREERVLASIWAPDSGMLSNDVETIMLKAQAYSSSRALLSVTYELRGGEACVEWLKAQEDSAL